MMSSCVDHFSGALRILYHHHLSFQTVRGRGLSHIGQLASDSEPFMIEQREM